MLASYWIVLQISETMLLVFQVFHTQVLGLLLVLSRVRKQVISQWQNQIKKRPVVKLDCM